MQLPETAGPLPASPGRSGKRYLRKVIFLFIVGIALLTLFSNTLLNYSVPQVTLQQAAPGALQYVISGSGAVEAAQTHDLYTSSVWPVSKVYVQTGDQVKNGQTLVTFDTKSAREALEDDRTRYEQRQIALEKLQEQYIEAQRSSDGQLIRTISLDIKSMQLDLEMMERQISRQEDSLQQSSVIKAPIDGIVIELNADRGAAVQAGMAAVRLADPAAGQRITLLLDSSQADRISVGDQAEAVFESLDNARIPAEVAIVRAPPVSGDGTAGSAAEPASGRKEVVLTLKDERLKGGETGEWTLVKKMQPSAMLLPSGAIREDADGEFVLLLKERNGPLGSEYFLQQAAVETGDQDETKTIVVKGITPRDQVVVSSSKPVADGDRVLAAE